MSVKIYTAQYRYSGAHRLDITVKGNDPIGKVFAPTWDMVMAHKKFGNDEIYINAYRSMMINAFVHNKDAWDNILGRKYVVLVCFCAAGKFCHRILLAEYFAKCGASYQGEITLDGKNFILPAAK